LASEDPALADDYVEVHREQVTLAPTMRVEAESLAVRRYEITPGDGQIQLHNESAADAGTSVMRLASLLVRKAQ
jgi:hypothetical protein